MPLDLPAVVEGVATASDGAVGERTPWRLFDGSPGGAGLRGPATGLARGDEVTVRVPGTGNTELVLEGTVAGRRHGGHGSEALGIELRAVAPNSGAWAMALLEGASAAPAEVPVVDERTEEHPWSRWVDRAVIALAAVTSVTVVAVLALVVAGLQPLVIRSGSMEPTYSVGDVVLVRSEPAGEVRTGQVVTRFDAPEAPDSLTHRVREVSRVGDRVDVTTRGDANESPERWSAPVGRRVGLVVASMPAVGLPLALIRTSLLGAGVAALAAVAMVALLLRSRARGSGEADPASESLTPPEVVPTRTAPSGTGETR
ncbi:MAG: signal peptidase I [Microthrixaceae bacterium]